MCLFSTQCFCFDGFFFPFSPFCIFAWFCFVWGSISPNIVQWMFSGFLFIFFVCPGLRARCSCLVIHSHTCRRTSWFECEYFVSYNMLYNAQQLSSNEYWKSCCLIAYTMLPLKTGSATSFSSTQASL